MSLLSVSRLRFAALPPRQGVWRHPRYRQFFAAKFLAQLGLAVQWFALTWLMAAQGKGAWMNAWQQVCSTAPLLLLLLPAGLLADRCNRAALLFLIHLALMLIGLIAAAGLAECQPGTLLLLSALLGAANALMLPSWQACVGELVEAQELPELAALNNLSFNLAALLGPLLGAWLFARSSVALLFLLQALAQWPMLLRCWQSARQHGGSRQVPPQAHGVARASMGLGERLLRLPALRRLLLWSVLSFAAGAAVPVLLPVLVREGWRGHATLLGLLQAAMGGGAVLSGLLSPLWRHRVSLPLLQALGCSLMALAMLLLLPPSDLLRRCACMALLGMGWALLVACTNGRAQALAHGSVAPAGRARLLSVYLLSVALGQTLGGLGLGWLAQRAGALAAWGTAALCLLSLAAFARASAAPAAQNLS